DSHVPRPQRRHAASADHRCRRSEARPDGLAWTEPLSACGAGVRADCAARCGKTQAAALRRWRACNVVQERRLRATYAVTNGAGRVRCFTAETRERFMSETSYGGPGSAYFLRARDPVLFHQAPHRRS